MVYFDTMMRMTWVIELKEKWASHFHISNLVPHGRLVPIKNEEASNGSMDWYKGPQMEWFLLVNTKQNRRD